MKSKDIKDKNISELNIILKNLKKELFNLRFLKSTGQLSNPSNVKKTRRSIAKVMTMMRINMYNKNIEYKNA